MSQISIKGFQGTSLLDFPGRVAALVFTGGCNLTCPYCHNPGLVLDASSFTDYPVSELLADLQKRKSFIDGVVISGGEPTLDAGLPAFLSQLKELGLQTKLDTNGLLPEVLADLMSDQLIDYLAVDVKTTPSLYSQLHSHQVNTEKLLATVALGKQAEVEVEFRTTCIPGLIDADAIDQLGELLRGAPLWVLQQFVPGHSLDPQWQQLEAYSAEKIEGFGEQAWNYVEKVQFRGL